MPDLTFEEAKAQLESALAVIMGEVTTLHTTEQLVASIIREFERYSGWHVVEYNFEGSVLNMRLMPPDEFIHVTFSVAGVDLDEPV